MVFCNNIYEFTNDNYGNVTILILIDGFLQSQAMQAQVNIIKGHNPYFNRWFSAMKKNV